MGGTRPRAVSQFHWQIENMLSRQAPRVRGEGASPAKTSASVDHSPRDAPHKPRPPARDYDGNPLFGFLKRVVSHRMSHAASRPSEARGGRVALLPPTRSQSPSYKPPPLPFLYPFFLYFHPTCAPSSRMSTPLVRTKRSRRRQPCLTAHPEKRKQEAERIRQKYPDRIPVRLTYSGRGLVNSDSLKVAIRLSARRLIGRTSPPSTRRSTSCPQYVEDSIRIDLRSNDMAGSHRRPVRLRYSEAHQARSGESYLYLRRRGPSTDSRTHERHLRGAQVSP